MAYIYEGQQGIVTATIFMNIGSVSTPGKVRLDGGSEEITAYSADFDLQLRPGARVRVVSLYVNGSVSVTKAETEQVICVGNDGTTHIEEFPNPYLEDDDERR